MEAAICVTEPLGGTRLLKVPGLLVRDDTGGGCMAVLGAGWFRERAEAAVSFFPNTRGLWDFQVV